MQDLNPLIMGTLISILISIIILPIIVKHRTRKIVSVHMKLTDAIKLSILPVILFVVIYQIFNNLYKFFPGVPNGLGLVGLFLGIFIMEIILMRTLIKESLDSARAKKLARSSAYYFFGFILCLLIVVVIVRKYI